jgi:hypothetical protein
MTKRHAVGCSFPPCTYHRRKSWCFTCARHRGEPEKVASPDSGATAATIVANGRAYQTGYDDGRAEGRREMLWLMAVGAEVERWRSQCSEDSFADCWYQWIRDSALRAIADLGDETAREMLR